MRSMPGCVSVSIFASAVRGSRLSGYFFVPPLVFPCYLYRGTTFFGVYSYVFFLFSFLFFLLYFSFFYLFFFCFFCFSMYPGVLFFCVACWREYVCCACRPYPVFNGILNRSIVLSTRVSTPFFCIVVLSSHYRKHYCYYLVSCTFNLYLPVVVL